jgi:pimeloyl-ACP methyl ester carboxylesterase
MLSSLLLSCVLSQVPGPTIQSKCEQVHPASPDGKWTRSPQRAKAVVLIHGYYLHVLDTSVAKPEYRPWQKADSPLVKELARNADVFVFAYGQNADLDTILKQSKLAEHVAGIRQLGYSEVILAGHSAGGLIARHFIEDNPQAGVTKVVQVCSPNAGSPLANLKGPKSQQPFIDCLTVDARLKTLKARADKQIPAKVEFLCVVGRGNGTTGSDGVVACTSQWSDDLQKQGIPAAGLLANHRDVMRDAKMVEALSKLICGPQPRWCSDRVEQARKEIFGK